MKNLLLILFLSLKTFALGNVVASEEGNTIQEPQFPRSVSTPVQAYDTAGEKVWECALDIYGKVMTVEGEASFVPFRFQGQYEDVETGLCYNRFRYYSADSGTYISQDPIGLRGGMSNFYSYVGDSNVQLDPVGLAPWANGGFNEWFNNASVQDIIDNKSSVSNALRGDGGMHEMFPVSQAAKAKELGFSAEEIMNMTVETDRITFTGVIDGDGNIVSGKHHSSSASWHFHDKLIKDLQGAKTKTDAMAIIDKHHSKHMKLKCK